MKPKTSPLPSWGRMILTSLMVGVGVVGYWSILNASPAPANSVISNQASAEYTSGTATYTVQSNTVETIVQPVGALTLTSDQTKTIGTGGGTLDFPHVITNTGNIADKFIVSASQGTSTIFDTVAMYNDANCDGAVDTPTVQFTGLTPSVPLNNQFCFVVRAQVKPSTAPISGTIEVKANGSSYPSTERTNTDTVTVTADASITVVKSADISSGGPGTPITYTLTFTNNGETDSGTILLHDVIPTDTTLVNGSLAITAGSAGTVVENAAFVTATIASGNGVTKGTSGSVTFQVTVDAGATGTIANTPWFCYNKDGSVGSPTAADVVPPACDTGTADGIPDDATAGHETGNTVNFAVLLDFLQKFQALDANCDGVIDGSYTQSQLTAGAVPGACIRYKIVASNNTGVTVTGVKIFDQTPTYTVFDDGSRNTAGAACNTGAVDADAATSVGGARGTGEVTAPLCGGTGPVNASLGSLATGNSAEFTFGVMIQKE